MHRQTSTRALRLQQLRPGVGALHGGGDVDLLHCHERLCHAAGLLGVGIVLMTVAVVAAPALFPALPTALGFLGVLVPLLFMEMRLAR